MLKKYTPGCPCCCDITWTPADAERWDLGDDWETVDDTFQPQVDGARLTLLDDYIGGTQRSYTWHLSSRDGTTWRLVFQQADADNYWYLEIHHGPWNPAEHLGEPAGCDVTLTVAHVVAGVETRQPSATAERALPVPLGPESLTLKLCVHEDAVAIQLSRYSGSLVEVLRYGLPGLTLADATVRIGLIAEKLPGDPEASPIYVSAVSYDCAFCGPVCEACADGLGPDSYQVVCSGFTGYLAGLNGTYVLAREGRVPFIAPWLPGLMTECQWRGGDVHEYLYHAAGELGVILWLGATWVLFREVAAVPCAVDHYVIAATSTNGAYSIAGGQVEVTAV